MTYFRHNRPNPSHAAHAAAVAQSLQFDPMIMPDAALIADRQAKRPNYNPLGSVPTGADYLVLDVPFGRKGSVDVRQWAKRIGARWQNSHKEWRIDASRICADRLQVINDLRLYLSHTTKAAPQYLARIANDQCVVVLSVPFDQRDKAKTAGAKWDSVRKAWYFTLKGRIGCLAFAKTVYDFECKGWVDLRATEEANYKHLGFASASELQAIRVTQATVAGQTPFSLATPKPNEQDTREAQVCAFLLQKFQYSVSPAPSHLIIGEEYRIEADFSGVLYTMRVQRIEGGPWVRWSFGPGGRPKPEWVSSWLPVEEVRQFWKEIMEKNKGKVVSVARLTLIETIHALAFGHHDLSGVSLCDPRAVTILRDRSKLVGDPLPR